MKIRAASFKEVLKWARDKHVEEEKSEQDRIIVTFHDDSKLHIISECEENTKDVSITVEPPIFIIHEI